MDRFIIFILTLIEISGFMLLWNLINKECSNRVIKSIIVVFSTALIVTASTFIEIDINSLVSYLFLLLAIKITFKKEINQLLIEFSLLACLCIMLQLVIIFIFSIYDITLLKGMDFLKSLAADITYFLIILCIYKFVPIEKISIIYKQKRTQIYFFCFNLMVYIIWAKSTWDYARPSSIYGIALFLALPAIFIVGNIFLSIRHMRNKELQKSLEDYQRYAPVISQLLEDVRRRQHDFKNHLNTIYGLVQVSDEKNLKETIRQYVHSLNSSLNDIEDILHIESTVVTAIIYNKINEARTKNIDFKYFIQCSILQYPLKDYELSEVLNNLLDNAFEAVSEPCCTDRKVYMTLDSSAEGYTIEIGNTGEPISPENISKIFGRGFSTKGEQGRGYGLYNVKRIIEGCNSRLQLSLRDGYTVFSIIFPYPNQTNM